MGRITGYGALEVQAVYISGNVRTPFEHYMENPAARFDMDWRRQRGYPRPDYLSSSRKRLAPQLIFKGGILNAWNRKMAVALNTGFYNTLPPLDEVDKADADVAWFVYDLRHDAAQNRYVLERHKTVYTKSPPIWRKVMQAEAGDEAAFLAHLEERLSSDYACNDQ